MFIDTLELLATSIIQHRHIENAIADGDPEAAQRQAASMWQVKRRLAALRAALADLEQREDRNFPQYQDLARSVAKRKWGIALEVLADLAGIRISDR
jgi:hypothetical protein